MSYSYSSPVFCTLSNNLMHITYANKQININVMHNCTSYAHTYTSPYWLTCVHNLRLLDVTITITVIICIVSQCTCPNSQIIQCYLLPYFAGAITMALREPAVIQRQKETVISILSIAQIFWREQAKIMCRIRRTFNIRKSLLPSFSVFRLTLTKFSAKFKHKNSTTALWCFSKQCLDERATLQGGAR